MNFALKNPLHLISLSPSFTLVHGIVDALVRFRTPIGKLVLVLLDELAAAIGGAAVNDNPFIVGEGLVDHPVVGFLQSLQIIDVDGDDG